MSASADPLEFAPERRLSGPTLLVLAFVMGTLFALLPMYYLYSTRGSSTAPAQLPSVPAASISSDSLLRDTSSDAVPVRFAARMTYELSHAPAEPPPAPVRVTTKAEPIVPRAAPALAPPPQAPRADAAPRVANAKPIIATPPDPRDTTREMEREARRPDYREPPRQVAQATVETPAAPPRVFEGRDFVLPPKPVPTRPIAAPENDAAKRAPEAPSNGRTTLATATVIPGVSPIAPPPEAKAPAEPPKPKPEATPADVLANRLTATREWLAGAAQTTHTIQIMGSANEEHLRNQLKALARQLDASKIYVYRTVAHGKPSMTVVYGAYADKAAAIQALEKLPPAVSVNKPVLRTVNGIRAEQKQHGTS
ncbi:MAG TPA: SPOR domain-containing protein [Burkholderiales bacterium]|nr:SPOR domain-containing protein [Burkholderiales bacterium]